MGLQPGDRIVSINGQRVAAEDITRLISGSAGKPVTLVVERQGSEVTLPPTRPEPSEGAYRLGFILAATGLPVHEAAWEAVALSWRVTEETGKALGRLATGEGRDDITSPVGIVEGSSDAAKEGATSFLAVLALISLSLALLNLLPLLPLDGGHIVFAVAEGIRGRAVRRQLYERVSAIGLGIVLILFLVGLSNDIGRLS
jgi:regulator of sigma E protease